MKEEEPLLEQKINEIKVNRVSEEERRRLAQLEKELLKQQDIERKLLKEKKIIIDQIIKKEPNIVLGWKQLKDFTEDEIVQINYDFFYKIVEKQKSQKLNRTKELLDSKFQRYDYFIREAQKQYFARVDKYFEECQVDFEEVNRTLKLNQEKERETNQKFEAAQNFLMKYQKEKKQEDQEKFKKEQIEFKQKVHEEIIKTIIESTHAQFKAHEEDQRKQQEQKLLSLRKGTNFVQQQKGRSDV